LGALNDEDCGAKLTTMLRILLLATVFVTLPIATTPAIAYQTRCSDPDRAGVLAEMSLRIPREDESAFAERMRHFDDVSSMSRGEVSSRDREGWRNRTIIFQSPEYSVVINVETQRNSDVALVTAERTCIDDALEDWRPFWSEFTRFVREEFPD
jgi:hypothetical protein